MTNERAFETFKRFYGRRVGILWEDPTDVDLGHYTSGELCGLRVRPWDGLSTVLAFEVRRGAPKDYLSDLIDVRDVASVVRAD